MQCMMQCEHYTKNENPNKLCNNEKRCKLFSNSFTCYDYKEKIIRISNLSKV